MPSSWPVSRTRCQNIYSPLMNYAERAKGVAKTHLLGRTKACGFSISNWRPVSIIDLDALHSLNIYFLDFLKLTTYLVFFTLIITFYGLPLNIIRDVYITARSFITRLRALHRYQTATRNMDQRYPNATEAEMVAMSDRTCIICREEMLLPGGPTTGLVGAPAPGHDGPNTTPKKLPCGHIFHFHCLRSWLERQQSCPTWFVLVLAFSSNFC